MQFLMALALRMGRTLSELRQEMTASELRMWIEYDKTSPLCDTRGDIQTAQIVSAVYGAQGVKVPLTDAMLDWSGKDAEMVDLFGNLESFLAQASS
ncbi:phage tail assembly protein T [Pectobacterium carotovorum]|uniref:phage tail assembly protein T n=1 Tax=Pectobacterium carotovorum TaxID=554 RepID=UPI003813A8FB